MAIMYQQSFNQHFWTIYFTSLIDNINMVIVPIEEALKGWGNILSPNKGCSRT